VLGAGFLVDAVAAAAGVQREAAAVVVDHHVAGSGSRRVLLGVVVDPDTAKADAGDVALRQRSIGPGGP